VRKQLDGCNHDNTLLRWLEKLPDDLRRLIKSKPGAGRWLELPP
jgi:hypothetical protein